MSLDSIAEEVIAGLIVAALVAVAGCLWKRRRTNEQASDDAGKAVEEAKPATEDFDVSSHPSIFDEKAHKLLLAIYDLAGDDPIQHVDISEAMEKARFTSKVGNVPYLCRYLKNKKRYIDTPYAGYDVVTITPEGIEAVRRQRGL